MAQDSNYGIPEKKSKEMKHCSRRSNIASSKYSELLKTQEPGLL